MSRLAALFAFLIVLAQTALPAAAANLKDVTSGLLRASDVPAGFAFAHEQFVTKFATVMSVQYHVTGSKKLGVATCTTSAAVKNQGWTDGAIQAFDASLAGTHLKVCAYRFSDSGGAHGAFLILSGSIHNRLSAHKAQPMTSAPIGDESATAVSSKKPGLARIFRYQAIYRQANIVVNFDFAGPALFSGAQFLHMVQVTRHRLH